MGRPSRTKLLEITLKLQQNQCANCSIPFKEIKGKASKISPRPQVNRKTNRINKWTKKNVDLTLSEALLTVFEAAFKINKITVFPTDTVLYMCKQCASCLSELYWAYKTFLEITKQESYIRTAIKTCLLWKGVENNESELDETLKTSKAEEKPNSAENAIAENAERSPHKERIDCRESLLALDDNFSENESDHCDFVDDPNDEDYLPGNKCSTVEATSARIVQVNTHNSKNRSKKETSSQHTANIVEQPTGNKVSMKNSLRSARKCRISEHPERKSRERATVIKLNLKGKLRFEKKKICKKRLISHSKAKKKDGKETSERNSCKICGKKFESLILMKTHSNKCNKVTRSSMCRYCGKKFSLKLLRDRHEGVFHSKELFQKGESLACKECGKTFKNLTFLRRHASVHSTAKPFQCETCLKSFKRFDTLQEHQRVKSHSLSLGPKSRIHADSDGNKTYPCKICNLVFKHKVSLFRHESKMHMEERPFGCEKCWKRYRNEEKLFFHLKTAHENRKEKERVIYKCDVCDKTYTYLYSYKAHVMTHVIDKPFLCSQCGNSFRQKQGFLRHMSTMHKPENRHTCSVCGKSFKRKDHLTQHLRGKTHGKPLKDKKTKKAQVIISNIISHTNKYNNINEPKSCQSTALTMSTHVTPTNSALRTTTIIVEAPSSCSNNFPQLNIVRPGVIVPVSSSIETNVLPNNETIHQPIAGQPSSFTFSASNLFFDF